MRQSVDVIPDGSRRPDGSVRYALDAVQDNWGRRDYRILSYPSYSLLTHPFELGLMIWD